MDSRPILRTRVNPHDFERLKRRLGYALLAVVVVTIVGTVGFLVIGGDEYTVIDAVYMTVITLTTVGYSEIIDMSQNPAGRVFTVVLLMSGMGIIAYSVPQIAAFAIEGHLLNIFTRRRMEKAISKLSAHHVVCGDTALASYVVGEMVRTDRKVVLVSPDEEHDDLTEELGVEVPQLSGDPTHDQALEYAGIDRARGLVSCMRSDKDNILVVLTARRLNANLRIVAAAEEPETEEKLRTAGADAVVSPSRIGGLRMASELVRPTVVSFLDTMLRDQRSSLRVEEVVVPREAAPGRTLRSLKVDELPGAMLLAVRRGPDEGFEFKPDLDLEIEAGMTLVVMSDAAGRAKVEERVR